MKFAYLLVEESFRELDARLLIAVHLLQKGVETVVCQQWWFMANVMKVPPGVVVFKGNNAVQANNMAVARQYGHKVASIEEEAFGLADYGVQKLFAPAVGDHCDLFLAQGKVQAEHLAAILPDMKGRVAVVGNARVDILRPPFRAQNPEKSAKIKKTYDRFILINSNIAPINPVDFDTFSYFSACVSLGIIDRNKPGDLERFHADRYWEKENFTAVLELIHYLENEIGPALGIQTVLRPHPSENAALWHRALAGLRYVHVEEDRDFMPWVLASEAMVHTGCTTGLEAFFLERPAFSLQPGRPGWVGSALSNIANPVFDTVPGLLVELKAVVAGRYDASRAGMTDESELSDYLLFAGEDTAAARIADALLALLEQVPYDASRISFKQKTFAALTESAQQKRKAPIDAEKLVARWHDLTYCIGYQTATAPAFPASGVAYFEAGAGL